MGAAVDHGTAHATDAFPAVVIKSDGFFGVQSQLLVDHVEHFQERHIRGDIMSFVGLKMSFALRAVLMPDFER